MCKGILKNTFVFLRIQHFCREKHKALSYSLNKRLNIQRHSLRVKSLRKMFLSLPGYPCLFNFQLPFSTYHYHLVVIKRNIVILS